MNVLGAIECLFVLLCSLITLYVFGVLFSTLDNVSNNVNDDIKYHHKKKQERRNNKK